MGKSRRTKTRKAPSRTMDGINKKISEKRNSKFFAWLGEIAASNMREEDFDKALAMFDKGMSVEAMQAELRKRYK